MLKFEGHLVWGGTYTYCWNVFRNHVKVRSKMASSSKVLRVPCVLMGYNVYEVGSVPRG